MGPQSIFEGKTLDDAVRKGIEALRLSRAEAMITVIEEGSGGFLGIGARPYRVRIMARPGGAIREAEEVAPREGRGRRERGERGGRGRREGREGRGGRGEPRGGPVAEAAREVAGPRREERRFGGGRDEGRGRGEERREARPPERRRGERPAYTEEPRRERAPEVEPGGYAVPEAVRAGEERGREEEDGRGKRRRRGRRGGRGRGGRRPEGAPAAPAIAGHGEMAPREEGFREERPREEGFREERPREERFLEERPREERLREERPREERFREERPRTPAGVAVSPGPGMSPERLAADGKRWTEDLLKAMGFQAKVSAVAELDRVDVTVEVTEGDDELLAGRKGEVRQALQHLLNRMLNRGEGSRYHLQLEINDFWKRREDELRALARQLAEEAVANQSEAVTEYLNAQERRIVHVTLREDPRVKTYALGNGMIKRLAVAPADFPEGPRGGEE